MAVVYEASAARSRAEQPANSTANAKGVTSAFGHDIANAKTLEFSNSDLVGYEALVVTAVSFLVLVGGNTAVWLLLLEALTLALSLEVSNSMRLGAAVGLVGVLSIAWVLLQRLSRQQKPFDTNSVYG